MFQLLFSLVLLAAPPGPADAERVERIRKLEGTQVELFTSPNGPDPQAKAEHIWHFTFVAPREPGGFEVTVTDTWRGAPAGSAVAPTTLTFPLKLEFGHCGSAHLKGTAVEKPEVSIEIISHRTRLCEDLPANDMLAFLRDGKTETRLYLAPDKR